MIVDVEPDIFSGTKLLVRQKLQTNVGVLLHDPFMYQMLSLICLMGITYTERIVVSAICTESPIYNQNDNNERLIMNVKMNTNYKCIIVKGH